MAGIIKHSHPIMPMPKKIHPSDVKLADTLGDNSTSKAPIKRITTPAAVRKATKLFGLNIILNIST